MTGRRPGTSGMLGWGKGRVYVSLRQEIKKYSQTMKENAGSLEDVLAFKFTY